MHPARTPKIFCEFFAGIGLVGEALGRSGWRCCYANDIDPKKRCMHEGHYGPSPHYHEGDVWAVDEVLDRIPGEPFLATASFPCTDMSLAGKRRGLAGAQSGALFGFLQILERLDRRRPQMILLENVPGFLTSHGGADFATAVDELASLGYWLDAFILDARWFVPQSRPRLFLAGHHDEIVGAPLIVRRDSDDSLSDPWRQAVENARRIHPARLREAFDVVSPATGWVAIDCGNPSQRNYALRDFIDVDAYSVSPHPRRAAAHGGALRRARRLPAHAPRRQRQANRARRRRRPSADALDDAS
jgi:DNA (cytosine-5)-methyltransferase 1